MIYCFIEYISVNEISYFTPSGSEAGAEKPKGEIYKQHRRNIVAILSILAIVLAQAAMKKHQLISPDENKNRKPC